MVHRRHHRLYAFPVCKGEHRHLGALEIFLDDDTVAALSEDFVLHDRSDRGEGLLSRRGYRHSLSESEAVGLDNRRKRRSFKEGERLRGAFEDLVGCGRDAVFLHQALREDLASLDLGSLRRRAEALDPRPVQPVDRSEAERIVGSDYRVVDLFGNRKIHDTVDVGGRHRHAYRVGGDPPVPGKSVYDLDLRILFEFFYYGVFAASAAYDQQFHSRSASLLCFFSVRDL